MQGNLIERLFSRRPDQPAKLLGSPSSPFIESYQTGDILDEKKRDQEIEKIAYRLKASQDRLNLILGTSPIIARNPQEVKEYKRWQEDQSKTWDVFYALAGLGTQFEESIAEARTPGGRPITHHEFQRYQVLQAGGESLIHDLIDRQLGYAQRRGFDSVFEPYVRLFEFSLVQNTHFIRINGVSLRELLIEDPHSHSSTAAAYQFIVEATLVRQRRSHEAVRKANKDPLLQDYPNVARSSIESVTGQIMALANFSPEAAGRYSFTQNQALFGEIARYAERAHRKIYDIRQNFYRTLLQPSSPEFASVKTVLESYFKMGKRIRVLALSAAGLDETVHVYELFRKSHEYAQNGPENPFFSLLEESVGELAEEVPTCEQILTLDDIDDIFDEDNPSVSINAKTPTIDSLGKIVSSVFGRSAQREYEIQPQAINWDKFIPPHNSVIKFDQNRPQRFSILLNYESASGEIRELKLSFDTKKGIFNWNIINAPTDSRLAVPHKSAFRVAESILSQIQAQAEKQYQEKMLQRRGVTEKPMVAEKKPKERFRDEAYDIRKQMRTERQTQANIEERTSILDTSFIEEEGVKKKIIVPEKEILENLLKSLSSVDREIIIRGLERFNRDGVGWFKKDKGIGKAGVPLFQLRINCTVPKGARVLVTPALSSNGEMRFEILDIDYRKNIFRKAGI